VKKVGELKNKYIRPASQRESGVGEMKKQAKDK
jgi:hypothetical protein